MKKNSIESGQEIYNLFTSIPLICNSGIFMPTNLIVALLVFIGANILLLFQSYISVLIVNFCLIINVVLYSFYFRKSKFVIEKSQIIISAQYENIKNQLDSHQLIMDFDTSEFELSIFRNEVNEVMKINTDKGIVLSKFSSIFSSASSLISIIVLYIGYLLVLNKDFTIGDILVLNSFIGILIPYTNKMIDQLNQYPIVIVNLQRVSDYLFDSFIPKQYGTKLISYIEKIEFTNMNFSFGDNKVFNSFKMKIDNSDTLVLIKGESGIGKSTLLNIIHLKLECSNYFINDVVSYEYSLLNLRKHFSYYHNSHGLINGTILDNLRYGNETKKIEEIYKICNLTEIHERIKQLPNGYYTQIKYNDLILSTGEIQRICLARTLLKKADFYLLDEPFSNLDEITADNILNK